MLLYKFLKLLAQLGVLVLYRKFYFLNSEKLPKKTGATIFAVNHPTAFSDSFIFLLFSSFNCYFMLRGDYFKVSPIIKWFMDQFQMIPIFRQRDGFSALKQNQALFESFYKMLHEKKDISIMVEGSHDHRKRLRPVQRGTARIVFGAYDKYGDTDINIVPVGLTYSDVTKFRSTVSVRFGDPIYLRNYIELHESNERKAMLDMTQEIEQRMKPLLVHVEEEEDDEVVEHLLDMNRNDSDLSLLSPLSKNPGHLNKEMALANRVNELSEENKISLKEQVKNYFQQLKNLNINDLGISQKENISLGISTLLLLGSPLFLLGFILGLIPLLITKKVSGMMKKKEFITSMMLVVGMLSYFFYFLILLIVGLVIGKWWLISGVLLMPLVSYFAVLYRDIFLKWNAVRKFRQLPKDRQENLAHLRKDILISF